MPSDSGIRPVSVMDRKVDMPPTFLNAEAIAAELDQLRQQLSRVQDDPELARAYGERLSRLGEQVTAACERAFLDLTADPAA